MWSVGVLTFDMLSGRMPFYSKDDHETLGKIKKGFNAEEQFSLKPWDSISVLAKDFVEQLLQADPKARLTPSRALKHPWIVDII